MLEGYEAGQTPLEIAGLLEEEPAIQLLLEALTTDLALEQGMIPPELGLGEWDVGRSTLLPLLRVWAGD